MALIRYYNLESRSWDAVSGLERNLQKHLLSEKHVKGLIDSADAEALAKGEASNDDSLATLLYDSGEFDVLYKRSSTITEGKKRWFKPNVAPRIGTEMVIQATPEDIVELQGYLASSGFEVVEARQVRKAIFEYRHQNHFTDGVEIYFERLARLIEKEFPEVDFYHGAYPEASTIELSFSGELQQVCKLRKYILQTKYNRIGGIETIIFID